MRRSEQKQVEPDLGILAARTLFGFQRELFTRLAAQGHPRLRPRHGAVLAYLDADGSRATDLAAQSGQHKQVIGTLVDELVALGYVERQPDPADRRAKLVVPTEKGLDHMARSDAIVAEVESAHAAAVGEQAYAAFKQVFAQVAERQAGGGVSPDEAT
ncbi:winged helix-turn-helix transcriptional regulator [Nonomuraea sp. NN258]|uniref:MarR family winged helix-turn-helix transcriptional regulator n=1 Tax=Nonomuraea antri TaxID=2730852 RepID=UPI001567D83F|nr:MarR family winged helix-turn-helix transcriptional regulator [Nonomuraea antri]NRQ32747.1 winged helix-turn-helix transcriptional regulator [Nonomuraea antri]